jgi:AAA+ superfamily predicted ATPase
MPQNLELSQINWQTLSQEINRIRDLLTKYIAGETPVNQISPPIPQTSSLAQLINKFGLSQFEKDLIILCLAIEIDPAISLLYSKAHGNENINYPTLNLALSLLPQANWNIISNQNLLQYWELIEIGSGLNLIHCPITLDRRILCFLLGESAIDEKLKSILTSFPSEIAHSILPQSHQNIVNDMIKNWSKINRYDQFPLLQICGSELTAKYQIGNAIAQKLRFNLGIISTSVLPIDINELHQIRKRWEREAILTDTVLLLDYDERVEEELNKQIAIHQFIENIKTPLIISSYQRKQSRYRPIISFDVPSLSYQEQKSIWQNNLGSITPELENYIDILSSQFSLSSSAIYSACIQLKNSSDSEALQQQLWNFCRIQGRPKLDDLAQRIEATSTLDDLVLPERQKDILKEIAAHLRQKLIVYQKWGFAQKSSRGLGLSALFSGQSGTGKTMAAEVLAKEFNLDLYRIDLSAVVSKYIGETEKNLRKIFDAAETGGVILLFDEADAIFGKRTEVKDSHDRHANVEVSYLLQRMEAYQGLAILTTNMKNALDSAFLRRIRFVIPFPFPDEKSRSEIWRRSFPPETPTHNLDFKKLGRLNLAGGNIRNIVLNAAVLAADEGEPIMMKHIIQAVTSEYMKLDMPLTELEIKDWG